MTQLLQVTKTEFAAIKGGILHFYHTKKGNRRYSEGDKIIFQETHGENNLTGEEYESTVNHVYEADGIKAGWTCLGFRNNIT